MPSAPLSKRALVSIFSSDIIRTGIQIEQDLLFQTISNVTLAAFSNWRTARVLMVYKGRNITLSDNMAGE
jgi:hypothetical protein